MKRYTVHYRTENERSIAGLADDAVFVKEGFSWPAFLIPMLWVIYHRMWWVLAGLILVQAVIAGLAEAVQLSENIIVAGSVAINFLMGFEGNNIRRWYLDRQRKRQHAVVYGDNLETAEHRFFNALAIELKKATPTVADAPAAP